MPVFYYMSADTQTKDTPKLPPSDEELVQKTLNDDKEYFGYLVERYESKLRRYLYRLGIGNPEDQLDVLQEVFLKAYRNLRSFDTKLRFSSWIYRIAHNEAVSFYRKKNVRPEGNLIFDSEEVLSFLNSNEEGAEVVFDKNISADEVRAALGKLDSKYREVLLLRYFEHKDYDEISDILRIPVGSVGTLLHRGKKKLAAVLNKRAIRI